MTDEPKCGSGLAGFQIEVINLGPCEPELIWHLEHTYKISIYGYPTGVNVA